MVGPIWFLVLLCVLMSRFLMYLAEVEVLAAWDLVLVSCECESMVEISRCGGEFCVVLAVVLGSVVLLVVARKLVSLVIMSLVVVEVCVELGMCGV